MQKQISIKKLTVDLPDGKYPLYMGNGILAEQLTLLLQSLDFERLVVIADASVLPLHNWAEQSLQLVADKLHLPLNVVTVPAGEKFKTTKTLGDIWDQMLAVGLNRRGGVITLGGGMVGDLGGFAAACFMRGIPLLHVPTTLLAFVDSSVGGKTGVNHLGGKNVIGAFKQPLGVVMDTKFLATLTERQLHSGWFELLKHGLIGDASLFWDAHNHQTKALAGTGQGLRQSISTKVWLELISRSCAVKIGLVEADQKELGVRSLLNFGHSLAHLIETHTKYDLCSHGEAVAVGMLFATWVSRQQDVLSQKEWQLVGDALLPLIKPLLIPHLNSEQFCQLLQRDKKFSAGNLNFILLNKIGNASIVADISLDRLWALFIGFISEYPLVLKLGTP